MDNQSNHHHIHRSNLDRLAISASTLCLLHCLAAPLILVLVPSFFEWASNLTVHLILGITVAGLAIFALGKGYLQHYQLPPLLTGIAGIALLALAFLVHEPQHNHTRLDLHVVLTVIGSSCLILAHILNLRACPSCKFHKFKIFGSQV